MTSFLVSKDAVLHFLEFAWQFYPLWITQLNDWCSPFTSCHRSPFCAWHWWRISKRLRRRLSIVDLQIGGSSGFGLLISMFSLISCLLGLRNIRVSRDLYKYSASHRPMLWQYQPCDQCISIWACSLSGINFQKSQQPNRKQSSV